jgi:hypothetical protein
MIDELLSLSQHALGCPALRFIDRNTPARLGAGNDAI